MSENMNISTIEKSVTKSISVTSLIWDEQLQAGLPRLIDTVPQHEYRILLSESWQLQRSKEAARRQKEKQLSWSAMYQRVDYLCVYGFAEAYLSSRNATTLQVAIFEDAILKVLVPRAHPHDRTFTLRDLSTPEFHQVLAENGVVLQGNGVLRIFTLCYLTVAYHTKTGYLEVVFRPEQKQSKRTRREFRICRSGCQLSIGTPGCLPQSKIEAAHRRQSATIRAQNRRNGQLGVNALQGTSASHMGTKNGCSSHNSFNTITNMTPKDSSSPTLYKDRIAVSVTSQPYSQTGTHDPLTLSAMDCHASGCHIDGGETTNPSEVQRISGHSPNVSLRSFAFPLVSRVNSQMYTTPVTTITCTTMRNTSFDTTHLNHTSTVRSQESARYSFFSSKNENFYNHSNQMVLIPPRHATKIPSSPSRECSFHPQLAFNIWSASDPSTLDRSNKKRSRSWSYNSTTAAIIGLSPNISADADGPSNVIATPSPVAEPSPIKMQRTDSFMQNRYSPLLQNKPAYFGDSNNAKACCAISKPKEFRLHPSAAHPATTATSQNTSVCPRSNEALDLLATIASFSRT